MAVPAPESIIDVIRGGGPLARLFQQASTEVRTSLEALLDRGWASQIARQISTEAHARLEEGIAQSPLVVLRECRAGCSTCCHTVSVDVTPLEAIVVAEYVRETFPQDRLEALKKRLATNTAARKQMTADERRQVRLACGLLGADGLCQVYPARPLVCAGVFSLSRAACEASVHQADLAGHVVPLDRPAKVWTMGVSGGLQRVLVEAGLDGNLYELNSIVLRAIEIPDAAARWLAGDDIFAECLCTDPHSPPRVPSGNKEKPFRRIDPPQTTAPANRALTPGQRPKRTNAEARRR